MSGMLEDLERRIDMARAKAKEKKAQAQLEKAQREADKARHNDSSGLF